jgi:hypothetical protein
VTAFVWGALLSLALAAPAIAQTSALPAAESTAAGSTEVDALRQRVASYWAARVARDSAAFWRLIEPRAQGRMTAEEYASQGANVTYTGYRVEEATINGNFATVKGVPQLPLTRARGVAVAPHAALLDDEWVRVRGVWYRVIDKVEQ